MGSIAKVYSKIWGRDRISQELLDIMTLLIGGWDEGLYTRVSSNFIDNFEFLLKNKHVIGEPLYIGGVVLNKYPLYSSLLKSVFFTPVLLFNRQDWWHYIQLSEPGNIRVVNKLLSLVCDVLDISPNDFRVWLNPRIDQKILSFLKTNEVVLSDFITLYSDINKGSFILKVAAKSVCEVFGSKDRKSGLAKVFRFVPAFVLSKKNFVISSLASLFVSVLLNEDRIGSLAFIFDDVLEKKSEGRSIIEVAKLLIPYVDMYSSPIGNIEGYRLYSFFLPAVLLSADRGDEWSMFVSKVVKIAKLVKASKLIDLNSKRSSREHKLVLAKLSVLGGKALYRWSSSRVAEQISKKVQVSDCYVMVSDKLKVKLNKVASLKVEKIYNLLNKDTKDLIFNKLNIKNILWIAKLYGNDKVIKYVDAVKKDGKNEVEALLIGVLTSFKDDRQHKQLGDLALLTLSDLFSVVSDRDLFIVTQKIQYHLYERIVSFGKSYNVAVPRFRNNSLIAGIVRFFTLLYMLDKQKPGAAGKALLCIPAALFVSGSTNRRICKSIEFLVMTSLLANSDVLLVPSGRVYRYVFGNVVSGFYDTNDMDIISNLNVDVFERSFLDKYLTRLNNILNLFK
jgi:hypothetical protein